MRVPLGRSVGIVAWVRASQAVLFEASVVPACVGTAVAVAAGAPFRVAYFALIVVSLVGIQAGANLLKGYYESLERGVPPSSAGSWLAFDSGAAVGLTRDPRTVLRVAWVGMAVGVIAGLVLVALTASVLLLALGLAGFALAWSYSSPPLRLSYRGIGELSTFVAFGPVMTVGSTVAFGPAAWMESLGVSVILGFLAASVSFSRYFPNEPEDRAKGKRTPVSLLGPRRAVTLLIGLLWAAIGVAFVAWILDDRLLWALLLVPFAFAAALAMPRAIARGNSYGLGIGLVVLAHVFAGVGLVLAFVA